MERERTSSHSTVYAKSTPKVQLPPCVMMYSKMYGVMKERKLAGFYTCSLYLNVQTMKVTEVHHETAEVLGLWVVENRYTKSNARQLTVSYGTVPISCFSLLDGEYPQLI